MEQNKFRDETIFIVGKAYPFLSEEPLPQFSIFYNVELPKNSSVNFEGWIRGVESFKQNYPEVDLQEAFDEIYSDPYLTSHNLKNGKTYFGSNKQRLASDNLAYLLGVKRFLDDKEVFEAMDKANLPSDAFEEFWLNVDWAFISFNRQWYTASSIASHIKKHRKRNKIDPKGKTTETT
jgi:hypothetical protein